MENDQAERAEERREERRQDNAEALNHVLMHGDWYVGIVTEDEGEHLLLICPPTVDARKNSLPRLCDHRTCEIFVKSADEYKGDRRNRPKMFDPAQAWAIFGHYAIEYAARQMQAL